MLSSLIRVNAFLLAAANPECTVFVVDDDDGAREALGCLLEAEGFGVRTYSCARGVLGETKVPDNNCLVTDFHMPGMDGLELVDELRRRGNSIPAILLTGDPNQHVRERAAAARVPVIEKLGAANSVVECIQKVVRGRVKEAARIAARPAAASITRAGLLEIAKIRRDGSNLWPGQTMRDSQLGPFLFACPLRAAMVTHYCVASSAFLFFSASRRLSSNDGQACASQYRDVVTETIRAGGRDDQSERYDIADAGPRERLIYRNALRLLLPQKPSLRAHSRGTPMLFAALSLCARCSQKCRRKCRG
jgi:two-component system, LuxR family, response regulator FixJ